MYVYICMYICNIQYVSPIVQPLEPVKQISLVANLGCEDFASWNGSERRWLVRSLGTDGLFLGAFCHSTSIFSAKFFH